MEKKKTKQKKEQVVSHGRTEVGWTIGSAGFLPGRSLSMPAAANVGVLRSGEPGELRSRGGGGGVKSMFAEPAITEPAVTCSAR